VLTGAQVVAERRRDGGKELWWLELDVKEKCSARELGREEKWCAETRGWCSLFIGAGGGGAQEAVAGE
jgi:hypothetical protein